MQASFAVFARSFSKRIYPFLISAAAFAATEASARLAAFETIYNEGMELRDLGGVSFSEEAESMLDQDQIQELIWLMHEQHEDRIARRLTRALESYIDTAELESGSGARCCGITNSCRVKFVDSKMSVIVKYEGSYSSIDGEMMAYVVSEIAKLHVVPTTRLRKVGGEQASLQYFVSGAEEGRVSMGYNYGKKYWQLYALDFMIINTDRHGGNWMKSAKKAVIGIDHGLTFTRHFKGPINNFFSSFKNPDIQTLEEETIVSRMKGLSRRAFYERFGATIKYEYIDFLLKRRDSILAAFKKADKKADKNAESPPQAAI